MMKLIFSPLNTKQSHTHREDDDEKKCAFSDIRLGTKKYSQNGHASRIFKLNESQNQTSSAPIKA